MFKNKVSKFLVAGGMALVGLVAGVATIAGAQSTAVTATHTNTPVVQSQIVDTPEPGDVADISGSAINDHADKTNDTDGNAVSETSEGSGSSDAGE